MKTYIVTTAQGQLVEVTAAKTELRPEQARVNFLDADGDTVASFVGYSAFFLKPAPVDVEA